MAREVREREIYDMYLGGAQVSLRVLCTQNVL